MSLLATLVAVGCGGSQDSGGGAAVSTATDAMEAQGGRGAPEPPMLGIHWARGQSPFGGGSGTSPLMTWHGGGVLSTTAVQPIFWGTSWQTSPGDKITGIDTFYDGIGGSAYAGTNTEYTGANGTKVTTSISASTHLVDFTSAPARAPKTSAILAEVCKMITNPVANGYYPVYVDSPRNHASYCAWHSWGTCNGVNIQFAFFFKLDGDAGCDPQDTSTTWSQGMEALANVSGHEISEALTDPRGDAWYDSAGSENADKCAWKFSGTRVQFSNSSWKIQGNWSNAAYNAGTGYGGNVGCIDGN